MLIGRDSESTVLKNRPWKHAKNFGRTSHEIKIFQSCRSYLLDQICATGSKRELHSVCQRKYLRFLSAAGWNSPQRTVTRFQVVNVCPISRFHLIAPALICELNFRATGGGLLPNLSAATLQSAVVDPFSVMRPAGSAVRAGGLRETDGFAPFRRDYINIPLSCRIAIKRNLPVIGRPPWTACIRVPKRCQLKRSRAVRV